MIDIFGDGRHLSVNILPRRRRFDLRNLSGFDVESAIGSATEDEPALAARRSLGADLERSVASGHRDGQGRSLGGIHCRRRGIFAPQASFHPCCWTFVSGNGFHSSSAQVRPTLRTRNKPRARTFRPVKLKLSKYKSALCV
jgi:hypothetical protein